jgi:hypothetical protein
MGGWILFVRSEQTAQRTDESAGLPTDPVSFVSPNSEQTEARKETARSLSRSLLNSSSPGGKGDVRVIAWSVYTVKANTRFKSMPRFFGLL